MPDTTLSLLNIFELPQAQQDIVLHLTRKGAADIPTLMSSLNLSESEVRDALKALVEAGKVRLGENGIAEIILGQTRKRALPTALLPVLLATDRLYSAQEIAMLRTVVPMLQFARAKMGEFADHGPSHALRVKSYVTQLGYALGLTASERHLLRAAALFHDVGNAVDRVRHHLISEDTVLKLTEKGELPFSEQEARLIGLLCRWHRGDYDAARTEILREETIHLGRLASILRIADKMDIDRRRYDYSRQFIKVLEFFYPHELPYWRGLEEVLGVRIACGKKLAIQVFTRANVSDNYQISSLRETLRSTPIPTELEVISVLPEDPPKREITGDEPLAVIAFPFDPHSLIMAGISRKHLQQAGYLVKMICYADSASGSRWFWNEMLPKLDPQMHKALVIIGDRPANITADAFRHVEAWRSGGVNVHLLNRHEANWQRMGDLRSMEVNSVLGGDWCYFWGDIASAADIQWGQIAALCSRDPTQTTVGISTEEEAIARGFLNAVQEAALQLPEDMMNWSSQADPLIKRIVNNDWGYFRDQSEAFSTIYATLEPTQIEQSVLLYEDATAGMSPQVYYWALEAGIEAHGRKTDRGIRFRKPYAIASWRDGDDVEILAINHWREEEAIPIRFLYPAEFDQVPEGHEGAIRVRVPSERAPAIITGLVNACNNKYL